MTQEETMEKDELTVLITARLGERQYKMLRMQEMEHRRCANRMTLRRTVYAAAACLVVVMLLFPWNRSENPIDALGINMTASEVFRAASPQSQSIADLIDAENFDEAQALVKVAIEESDNNLRQLSGCDKDDEETVYLDSMERMHNAELRWLHACLLVRAGQYKAASYELNRYLEEDRFREHEEEARALLEKIKK